MSNIELNNLLAYIQGLNLSQSNRQWLADRIIEPDNVMPAAYSLDEVRSLLAERQKETKEGKYITLEEFEEEIATW